MSQQAITPRADDYSQWYLDVISSADLIDSSPVRGCMVIRPHGYAVWEAIKDDLDRRFKETGHVNAYFPLFIPQSFLSKEAEHVEGFAKECALVTHHRLRAAEGGGVEPDPAAKLEEALVVRPTSETIIWHMYGRWIRSYRDLPLLINQWANVVRWEMRTRPFLRTAEFLWQEGHTAHATKAEAEAEATRMLEVYRDFAAETLAVPCITGVKSATERFAGAEDTYTIEAMMQNGWALQAGTSHFLGQNFARAFDVTFQNTAGEMEHVWATSWGVSTRLVGAVIMTHSDDTGLVLPPRVAPIQVVVTPLWRKDADKDAVMAFANDVRARLSPHFRVHVDAREKMKPGAKYYEWERKGVPLRMEIGPRDVAKTSVFCAVRTGGKKFGLEVGGGFVEAVRAKLDEIQKGLFDAALARRERNTHRVESYDAMKAQLAEAPGFFLVPWKDDPDAEAAIKADCKATIRCYPGDMQGEAAGRRCFYSGAPATHMAIFARAY
ncbi:MAG: proline--tRNA ligase [Myxococcota bacterium]|nr:proline--tRNA ligase [Myxococcota bacterium]MEC8423064.1 proline--tRNA ligase [Myxococcota bacterium]